MIDLLCGIELAGNGSRPKSMYGKAFNDTQRRSLRLSHKRRWRVGDQNVPERRIMLSFKGTSAQVANTIPR
jgi:hypothetical protein